jgi:hypothetical protein
MSKESKEIVLAKIIARPVYGQSPDEEQKWVGEIHVGDKHIFEGNPGTKDDALRHCSNFVFMEEKKRNHEFFRYYAGKLGKGRYKSVAGGLE